MKNLLIAILLLGSLTASAVPPSVNITNTSTCTVYYALIMSAPNNTPTCTMGALSTVLTLAPGASITYYNAGVPGVSSANRAFLGARIYNGPAACAPTYLSVGDPCTLLGSSATQTVNRPGCTPCSATQVTAAWTTTTPIGYWTLTFTN